MPPSTRMDRAALAIIRSVALFTGTGILSVANPVGLRKEYNIAHKGAVGLLMGGTSDVYNFAHRGIVGLLMGASAYGFYEVGRGCYFVMGAAQQRARAYMAAEAAEETAKKQMDDIGNSTLTNGLDGGGADGGRMDDIGNSTLTNGLDGGGADGGRVLFSVCKGETHTQKQGFKQLFRRLRSMYRPETLISRDDFTLENLRAAAIVVLGCPKEKFSTQEFAVLKRYVQSGGSVLVMLGEGGETKAGTNINYWLEEYGMSVNSDSVVRTTHYKYLHPKEALISDGILNRAVISTAGKSNASEGENDDDFRDRQRAKHEVLISDGILNRAVISTVGKSNASEGENDDDFRDRQRAAFDSTGLDFVYPYGSTISVAKPAVPILSTAGWQLTEPKLLWACHRSKGALINEPRVGLSVTMFDDDQCRQGGYQQSDGLLSMDNEDIPRDWTTLFDDTLFKFDTNLVPEAVALYDRLNVKKTPLSVIPPSFEMPLPPLEPAVFPPAIREPPPPALELFDLDENFASEHNRLAYLTNKCNKNDLEYYVAEAGHILGLRLGEESGAKAVLSEVFKRVAMWKMVQSVGGGGMDFGADMGMGAGVGLSSFAQFEL
eukprot:gene29962-18028_t